MPGVPAAPIWPGRLIGARAHRTRLQTERLIKLIWRQHEDGARTRMQMTSRIVSAIRPDAIHLTGALSNARTPACARPRARLTTGPHDNRYTWPGRGALAAAPARSAQVAARKLRQRRVCSRARAPKVALVRRAKCVAIMRPACPRAACCNTAAPARARPAPPGRRRKLAPGATVLGCPNWHGIRAAPGACRRARRPLCVCECECVRVRAYGLLARDVCVRRAHSCPRASGGGAAHG